MVSFPVTCFSSIELSPIFEALLNFSQKVQRHFSKIRSTVDRDLCQTFILRINLETEAHTTMLTGPDLRIKKLLRRVEMLRMYRYQFESI